MAFWSMSFQTEEMRNSHASVPIPAGILICGVYSVKLDDS